MTRHAKPLLTAVAGAVLTVVFVVLSPGAASAHAVLESTVPAAGSSVSSSPQRIELTFGESVTIPDGAIRLYDGNGKQIDLGAVDHPGDDGARMTASVPTLAKGTYVVAWRAISADSHPVNGAFTFSVGAPSTDASGLVAEYQDAGGSRTVGVIHGAVRSIGYGAAAVLIGGFALVAFCWPGGAGSERARRWMRWAGFAGVAASLASIPLQAAYGEGDGFGQVFDTSLWSEVVTSRFGWSALLRAAAFAAGIALASLLDTARTRRWLISAMGTAVVIAATFAFAGHGATGRWPLGGALLDVVHVLSIGAWLGGLVGLLAWVLRDADFDVSVDATRRFSSEALIAVALIVMSGGLQGLRQVGWSWDALSTTTYGRLLLVKVGLVALVVVIAWLSRRHLGHIRVAEVGERQFIPLGGGAGSVTETARVAIDPRRALRRTVACETAGLVIVLVVSAVLSVTIPAREAVELPFDAIVRSGDATATIDVIPAKAGSNQIHVTVFGTNGDIPDIAEMDVELRLPSKDLGPIKVPMTEIASNHYLTDSAVIPLPGDWRLTVQARIGDFDQDTFEVTVPVR